MSRLNRFAEFANRTPQLQDINSNERPVAWFFYGPLTQTPQGIACLVFCLCAIAAATVFVAAPSETPIFGFRMVLVVWPLVVFAAFAMLGYRNGFRPSLVHALVVAIVGLVPFVLPYFYVAA